MDHVCWRSTNRLAHERVRESRDGHYSLSNHVTCSYSSLTDHRSRLSPYFCTFIWPAIRLVLPFTLFRGNSMQNYTIAWAQNFFDNWCGFRCGVKAQRDQTDDPLRENWQAQKIATNFDMCVCVCVCDASNAAKANGFQFKFSELVLWPLTFVWTVVNTLTHEQSVRGDSEKAMSKADECDGPLRVRTKKKATS